MALENTEESFFSFKLGYTFFGLLLVSLILRRMLYYMGTPKGPWGLPIFGYMFAISKEPYLDFVQLAKKYGDVFSVTIGARHVIVLNSYEAIKEAFVKKGDFYAGKPRDGVEAIFGDRKSVFVTDGEIWKEQRRFLLSSMRNLGFGRTEMEEHIQNEVEIAAQEFKKSNGLSFDLLKITTPIANNMITYLIFGRRLSDDAVLKQHLEDMNEIFGDDFNFTNIADAFPILEKEFFLENFMTTLVKMRELKEKIYAHMRKFIDQHKKTFDENHIRDVTDSYLEKIHALEQKGKNSKETLFSNEFSLPNMVLLFSAGTETTANTIAWSLKVLSEYPKIQKQVQDEIDRVVGRSRPPTMADRMNMPFTEATILEIHRVVSLVPLTFYHRITDDTKLQDYKIPKNAYVLANLWNVHNSPQIWEKPNEFNPQRFIDENGKISNLREKVIPFSIGSRNCLGESLAKMEIFLCLTSFLQKFSFTSPEEEKCNLKPTVFTPLRKLKAYKVCAFERE